jgi:hypothetical protein
MSADQLTRLTGTVIDLHAKSGDNWSRAKIRVLNGRTYWVTAKFRIELGETFDADCTFNSKYKSFDCVKLAAPADGVVSNEVVILKLVDILPGVGKVKAHTLGEKFPNLYEVLVASPEKIAEACGAALADVEKVSALLGGEQTDLIRVTTLMSKGYPNHLAKRIAKEDRQYVVAMESPYAAIRLVSGLGWLLADEIGRKQKIAYDDPRRIEAGIDFHYREKVANDGHTIVHVDDLLDADNLPSLLGVKKDLISEFIDKVLIPRGDGWYTNERHRDNATVIAEFFMGNNETPE